MLRAALLCCALPTLASASWRDPPLAASSIFSLDGSDWSVTGEGRGFSPKCTGGASAGPDDGCCEYENGVDFTAGSVDYDNGNGVTAIAYALISRDAASSARRRRAAPRLCGRRRRPDLQSHTRRGPHHLRRPSVSS